MKSISQNIRPARKPREGNVISGIAVVMSEGKKRLVPINYTDKLIQIAGKLLPLGVCEDFPAYVFAVQVNDSWEVYIKYLNRPNRALLWVQSRIPKWAACNRRA